MPRFCCRRRRMHTIKVGILLITFTVIYYYFTMENGGGNHTEFDSATANDYSKVGLAFALSISAGLATCIGGLIVFCKGCIHLANPRALAVSLSLSAGVMVFISLVEIFGESINNFKHGFKSTHWVPVNKSCGELGYEYVSRTDVHYKCHHCDATCDGHAWTSASATFVLGVIIIFLMDFIVHKISPAAEEELEVSDLNALQESLSECCPKNAEGVPFSANGHKVEIKGSNFGQISKQQLNRTGVLTALAIGLHNIPEGVATFIGAIRSTRLGVTLAIGIALHNIPEGIAVATPVYFATGSRLKAFLWTFVSALAEPLGAVLAFAIVGQGLNPYVEGAMFGVVTGMMVTISFKELIPNAIKYHSEGNTVIFSILSGMAIMVLSLILFAYAGV